MTDGDVGSGSWLGTILRSIIRRASGYVKFAITIVHEDKAASSNSQFLGQPGLNDNPQHLVMDLANPASERRQLVATCRKRDVESQLTIDKSDWALERDSVGHEKVLVVPNVEVNRSKAGADPAPQET